MGVCECAVSDELHQISLSYLSGIVPSESQVPSSISDDAYAVTAVSGLNSVGEDKTMMFKTYCGTLSILLRWYEYSLGTCHRGDLSVKPSRGEENDARDTVRLYKDTLREDVIQRGDPLFRAPAQQELKIS